MEEITIKDIARICGVGVSTVSRAINNHPDINPATKDMIMRVIKENNYVPNNSARNLKRSNAKAIAILVKGMDNMFFNNMISVIEEVVRKKKYACIIERVEEKANEVDSAIEIVKEKRLRGIIFLGGNFTHPHEKMAQIPVPYVISTIGAVSDGGKPCASVSVDDYRESYKMVDYLCGLGHRRIAIITACEDDISIGRLRLNAYRQALLDHGIPYDPDLVFHMTKDDTYSFATGYKITKEILEKILLEDPDTQGDRSEMVVFVDQLADSAVIMGLRVWVPTDSYWSVKWRLNQKIKEEFDAQGIVIPYNQMDIYVHHKD